jgi:hypothetical protein
VSTSAAATISTRWTATASWSNYWRPDGQDRSLSVADGIDPAANAARIADAVRRRPRAARQCCSRRKCRDFSTRRGPGRRMSGSKTMTKCSRPFATRRTKTASGFTSDRSRCGRGTPACQ